MQAVLETEHSTGAVKKAGFWKRQFASEPTFGQVLFDISAGVIAPITCLALDPGVFRWGGLGKLSPSFLVRFQVFFYVEIAISIAALCVYLMTRRASPFWAGMFFTAGLFSLAVGISIFPLSLVGLFMLIGILGFTPFVTAGVFLRNAYRCWSFSNPGRLPRKLLFTAAAAVLTFAVPLGVQSETSRLATNAFAVLENGADRDADDAIHTLKQIRLFIDADRLVTAYQNTGNEKYQERLSRAYRELTGERIEERLAILND